MIRRAASAATWIVLMTALGACEVSGAREPVAGGPCEGCDEVFRDLPETLGSSARIALEEEPGEPMRIEGVVRDAQGRAAPGVIVYAYHTNAKGIYPLDDETSPGGRSRHGALRAWAKTDDQGRYRFDTIRPAGYPSSDIPEHVHMHIIEPGRCTYYIDDVQFEDDERLSDRHKSWARDRGGPGITTPRREKSGRWLVTRDIVLGMNVEGYEECESQAARGT